ncbi:hypothetical protein GBAR_LOCUS27568 [Geodia barretti]|uniref:Uncharacterized protein n=1 Tax=Geodia barretti TaxID=519541 RepID=A0AA35TKT8_GEOBA|nr:hypothetical protein GBAR_LOCUS27568 [Geodia barretti]
MDTLSVTLASGLEDFHCIYSGGFQVTLTLVWLAIDNVTSRGGLGVPGYEERFLPERRERERE